MLLPEILTVAAPFLSFLMMPGALLDSAKLVFGEEEKKKTTGGVSLF